MFSTAGAAAGLGGHVCAADGGRQRLGVQQITTPAHTQVLRRASEGVFVPLTVGGGIRGFTDGEGRSYSARDVAAEYFRSGADKVRTASCPLSFYCAAVPCYGRAKHAHWQYLHSSWS